MNKFTEARKHYKTIGECADALAEAFADEMSMVGYIILERALEKATGMDSIKFSDKDGNSIYLSQCPVVTEAYDRFKAKMEEFGLSKP